MNRHISLRALAVIVLLLAGKAAAETPNRVTILYGGSVKPDNIQGLMAQEQLDGALVGGASLDAKSFASIVKEAS